MRAVQSKPTTLLEALESLVPGASRRSLRQMLEQGRVSVNGATKVERLLTVKEGESAHGPQMLPGGEAVLFSIGGTRFSAALFEAVLPLSFALMSFHFAMRLGEPPRPAEGA